MTREQFLSLGPSGLKDVIAVTLDGELASVVVSDVDTRGGTPRDVPSDEPGGRNDQ